VILPEADTLLAPVTNVDGFVLACLVDASTGMVLAGQQERDEVSLPAAAAGAADIAGVISLLSGRLGTGEALEDVMLTFSGHIHVLRQITAEREPQVLLLVVLDRLKTNLALARREIRDFCASLAA
jgi:hypothetical protein